MSRSYGKVPARYHERRFDHNQNKEFRARCRLGMHREMTSPEYGDVLFPFHKRYSTIARVNDHNCKNKIRNGYSLEISNILSGIKGRDGIYLDEAFIKAFYCIKANAPYKKPRWKLDWLDAKAVKKAVKAWRGEPLEILKSLFRCGCIEQAVRMAFKIYMAK